MEELILALIEFVADGGLLSLIEYVMEAASKPVDPASQRSHSPNPFVAGIGFVILGGAAGLLSGWLLPHALLRKVSPVPGISLLVAPLCVGLFMRWFGQWRRKRGAEPTLLATFWGGALFAFALAMVRWLVVGRG